ncbi:MAG: hypothetical protein IJC09_03505 [Clostridia bacterium]|nr:hypothetical protein [Clostridia bacterium]
MKRRIKLYGLILSLMLLVTGCGCSGGDVIVEKPSKRKPSTGESWTVMIYMSASSLEDEYGRAGEVLNSLSYDLPENVNVIVEAGGCNEWSIEGIKNDKLQDFEVQKNGIRLIGERPLANMGKASTYADFLNRTIKDYPADRYISVIWGEGGNPVSGVAYDALYEYDSLTASEIAGALASTETKLDIIGFDAGMMSNLEVAAALVPYADYMVASEDIMPLSGWDYRGLFSFLSENPDSGPAQVAQVICDGVSDNVWDEYESIVSMSVIDLSDVTKLMQDFDTLAWGMAGDAENSDKLRAIKAQLDKAERMGAGTIFEGQSNVIDLGSFRNAVYSAVKTDYTNIDRAISNAVIYRTAGKLHSDSCGISIYYPRNGLATDINEYKKICVSAGYNEFIDKTTANDAVSDRVADYKATASWQAYNSVVEANTVTAEPDLNGKYLLYASNPDIIKKPSVNLYKYNEEEGIYLYLASDSEVSYSNITNSYEYRLTNKQLELNGIAVSSYLINSMDGMALYSIPVIYEDEISSIRVLAKETEKEKSYKVLGIWQGTDAKTGIIGRKYKTPSVGDTIIPIYETYGEYKGKYVEGKSLTLVFGGLNIKEKTLDDGEYLLSYTVEDIFGKVTQSNTTNVTAIKGKMQISR